MAGPGGHRGMPGAVSWCRSCARQVPRRWRRSWPRKPLSILSAGCPPRSTRFIPPSSPHPGSRGATSDRWLDELQAAEAVISVGAKNRYGHPAPETLARLRGHGVTVLRTDQRGTITFTVSSHGTIAITDVGHHD